MNRVSVRVAPLLALAVVTAGAGHSAPPKNPPLSMTFLKLERGEATVIRPPGGTVDLAGTGGPGDGATILRYLKSHGVRMVETLLLPACNSREMGGAEAILQGIPVRQVMLMPIQLDTAAVKRVTALADKLEKAHRTKTFVPPPGFIATVFFSPPCQFRAVGPTGPMLKPFEKDADCSVTLEVTYDKISWLRLGETRSKHQKTLWSQIDQKPWGHLLEIGHSGAEGSLLPGLLKPLHTRVAVIPVPEKAPERPAASTLASLKQAGVRVYRTDRQGSITVTTDGHDLQVKPER